jgi:hypothetical protein
MQLPSAPEIEDVEQRLQSGMELASREVGHRRDVHSGHCGDIGRLLEAGIVRYGLLSTAWSGRNGGSS